jgi:hypothetical protein
MKTFGEFINKKSLGASQATQIQESMDKEKGNRFVDELLKLMKKYDNNMDVKWFAILTGAAFNEKYKLEDLALFCEIFKKMQPKDKPKD